MEVIKITDLICLHLFLICISMKLLCLLLIVLYVISSGEKNFTCSDSFSKFQAFFIDIGFFCQPFQMFVGPQKLCLFSLSFSLSFVLFQLNLLFFCYSRAFVDVMLAVFFGPFSSCLLLTAFNTIFFRTSVASSATIDRKIEYALVSKLTKFLLFFTLTKFLFGRYFNDSSC